MNRWHSGRIDSAELKRVGGEELPDGDGIQLHGWRVQSRKAPILSDAKADELKASLGKVTSLPEQLFADSFLTLTHAASGVALKFRAADALQRWRDLDLPPVQVGHATEWTQSRQRDIHVHAAVTLNYDWTFTTDYAGTVEQQSGTEASTSEALWEDSTEAIDRSLLMARDPILFYDEVPLYESELDDNGVSQLTVKVRVMAECWFVLLRFWLRVDGVLVRLREVRFCGKFTGASPGGVDVTREVRHSEGTFEDLRQAGAPGEGAAYANADIASEALQAVAPIGCTYFQIEELRSIGTTS